MPVFLNKFCDSFFHGGLQKEIQKIQAISRQCESLPLEANKLFTKKENTNFFPW